MVYGFTMVYQMIRLSLPYLGGFCSSFKCAWAGMGQVKSLGFPGPWLLTHPQTFGNWPFCRFNTPCALILHDDMSHLLFLFWIHGPKPKPIERPWSSRSSPFFVAPPPAASPVPRVHGGWHGHRGGNGAWSWSAGTCPVWCGRSRRFAQDLSKENISDQWDSQPGIIGVKPMKWNGDRTGYYCNGM